MGSFKLQKAIIEYQNEEIELEIAMAFIFNGYKPSTDFIKNLGITNKTGLIEINEFYETKVANIYAIGDVNTKEIKQVATAVGDGAYVASKILK